MPHPLATSGRVFVTADTHFGQDSAVSSYDRPFRDAADMDAAYIDAINAAAGPDDLLLHLGDFVGDLGSKREKTAVARDIRSRLAVGRIVLVRGNHDADRADYRSIFDAVHDILDVRWPEKGERVVCCHYPMRCWRGNRRGTCHLYGHTHGRLEEIGRATDVGVDCWQGRPVPLDHLVGTLRTRQIVALPMRRLRRQPDRPGFTGE